MHVLLIEDDKMIASFIKKGLKEENHIVESYSDGIDGQFAASSGEYDVIILDRNLPSLDGLSIIQYLRNNDVTTPILILSAMAEIDQRVEGLQAGANDYLVKPFAFSELLARITNLGLNRRHQANITSIQVADLSLNLLNHTAIRADQTIDLRDMEYRLLSYFMRHANQALTRTMLFEQVWGYYFDPQTNLVDIHVSRLRKKIDIPFKSRLIHTVLGVGYMIKGDKHVS